MRRQRRRCRPATSSSFGTRPTAARSASRTSGGPSIIWLGGDVHGCSAAVCNARAFPTPLWDRWRRRRDRGDLPASRPTSSGLGQYRLGQGSARGRPRPEVRRAEAAGCWTLVLTLDVPVRTTRPREVATGIARRPQRHPGHPGADRPRAGLGDGGVAAWCVAALRESAPGNGANASLNEVGAAFARREMRGAFTWDEAENVPRPLEGHAGGQWASCIRRMPKRRCRSGSTASLSPITVAARSKALPAAIDALPAIVRQVGKRATVLMENWACAAAATWVRACCARRGRGFCRQGVFVGTGRAPGESRPGHVIDLLIDETPGRTRPTSAPTASRRRAR